MAVVHTEAGIPSNKFCLMHACSTKISQELERDSPKQKLMHLRSSQNIALEKVARVCLSKSE